MIFSKIHKALGGNVKWCISGAAPLNPDIARFFHGAGLLILEGLGIAASGLDRLVTMAFSLLGLITFYTIANQKLRAWELERGALAPKAAGKIHSDMEHTFIRAQVASFENIQQHTSFQELNRLGLLRTEGKEYQVQDGDVIEFSFAGS